MKNLHSLVSLLALGLFLGFLQLASPYLHGQNASTNSQPAGKQFDKGQHAKTFIGRILQVDGRFVLQDNASMDTYLLDDQEKAKPFGGRKVKVIGMLDAPRKTIHVL